MKRIVLSLLALGLVAGAIPQANAAACAAGPHRAGCVGPRGAVVTHHPYARPVYGRPAYVAPRCVWRAGVRVCR
jgi:hypothetical protein